MLTTCRKGLLKTCWVCGLLLLSSQAIAASGDSVARWIDAFFDDPSVEEEKAESRLDFDNRAHPANATRTNIECA